jgi:uncharacterized lipoprotein NlpE involved in copper resistance
MVKKFTYSVLALILFVLICIDARAQSGGKIAGKIIDQKTSETLIGATIAVQGSNKGAAANIDGRYVINDLKPGTYTVIVKYIGYQTKEISDVQVTAGAVTNLDIVMQQAVSQSLNEVVIKATYRQASIASLYAIQKTNSWWCVV